MSFEILKTNGVIQHIFIISTIYKTYMSSG